MLSILKKCWNYVVWGTWSTHRHQWHMTEGHVPDVRCATCGQWWDWGRDDDGRDLNALNPERVG